MGFSKAYTLPYGVFQDVILLEDTATTLFQKNSKNVTTTPVTAKTTAKTTTATTIQTQERANFALG